MFSTIPCVRHNSSLPKAKVSRFESGPLPHRNLKKKRKAPLDRAKVNKQTYARYAKWLAEDDSPEAIEAAFQRERELAKKARRESS